MLAARDSAFAQDEREKALQLMQLTGAHQLAMQVISAVLPKQMQLVRAANPDTDERFLQRLTEQLLAEAQASQSEVLEIAAGIYARHFSSAELDALVAFYRAPLGQKVVQVTPAIMQELGTAGEAWGQALAARAITRLEGRSD
jgi:hypothetical protein